MYMIDLKGAVFVHQANDLVGIFTERDYLKRVLVKGKFSKDASVESVMTKEVLTGKFWIAKI